jgi:2-iminobutanoate/2-iminopropanoate deaminase
MKPPHLTSSMAAGAAVYTSGVLARDDQGRISGDIRGQTRQALSNLQRLLADHDLALADVVKTTVWLRHAEDAPAFNEVYASMFGTHRPCRSTVVSGLVAPEALIEVEAYPRAAAV